ncbi:MAG: hypothetical protein J7L54_07335 [Elusimicrobia bacterium]|nr:hypothetical protein [Elusimicrobiota bacterium]
MRKIAVVGLFFFFFAFSVFFQKVAESHFVFRNTNVFSRYFYEAAHYQDFWITFFGHRRIAADVAFIQLLQYYGKVPEEELPESEMGKHRDHFLSFSKHKRLLNYALRCVRLDRNFDYAYLFSAAALAWVQKRKSEAVKILIEGIEDYKKYNEVFSKAVLYLSAIQVRDEKGDVAVLPYLEEAIKMPDCPDMVKNILAFIYEKQGDYKNASRIWLMLVNSRDKRYRKESRRKLAQYESRLPR